MTDCLQPTVHLESDVLLTAIKHGCELWWDESSPTKRLDQREDQGQFTRFVNARVQGKAGEAAYSRFLSEYHNVESKVDWRIYGTYEQTDNGDLRCLVDIDDGWYAPQVDIEIKTTKPWNSWLAIRSRIFRKLSDDAPIILMKTVTEEDIVLDEWEDVGDWDVVQADERFQERFVEFTENNCPLDVQLVGSVYTDEFTDHFDAGDRLYDPETGAKLGNPLREDNEGIHVSDIDCSRERWNRICTEIIGSNPISYRMV